MPVIDYSNYAANQSEWVHSLLKLATKSEAATAEELGRQAEEALQRVTHYLPNRTERK